MRSIHPLTDQREAPCRSSAAPAATPIKKEHHQHHHYPEPTPDRRFFCASILGASLVYFAGFSHIEAVHNAAHDTRHSSAFPCH